VGVRLLGSKRLVFGVPRARRVTSGGPEGNPEPVRLEPVGRNLPEKRSQAAADIVSTRLFDLIAEPSSAGQAVTEKTALGVAAVTACVGLLADMIAKLPVYLYRPSRKGPREITNHPAIKLLAGVPSYLHTNYELRSLMMTGVGLGGNGYARIFRDAFYEPRAIEWLAPCDVTPELVKRPSGERFVRYKVQGVAEPLTRADIIHVRGFCFDGIMGMSPIRMLRESIGTSLAQTKAAGNLMRNGTRWPGIMVLEGVTKKEVLEDARDEVNRNLTGTMNAGRLPVIGGNMKFIQTNGMSFVDAQFVESRKMELHEVARHYRVPAFMVDSTATSTWGTGIEQQTLGFLNFSLDPYLVAWEQSLALSLLTGEEIAAGYAFQFDRDKLANVALEARANFFQTMRNIGVFSPNDVRAELGYTMIAPEDGGDDYGRPFNASGGTPQPAAEPAPAPEPQPTPATEPDDDDEEEPPTD
jgi:HK97 family phage portal protein